MFDSLCRMFLTRLFSENGCQAVPSVCFACGSKWGGVKKAMQQQQWAMAVLKPAIGASGENVGLLVLDSVGTRGLLSLLLFLFSILDLLQKRSTSHKCCSNAIWLDSLFDYLLTLLMTRFCSRFCLRSNREARSCCAAVYC